MPTWLHVGLIFRLLGRLGGILGHLGGVLGRLGGILGHLVGVLGRLGGLLRPLGAVLGDLKASWWRLGPLEPRFGPGGFSRPAGASYNRCDSLDSANCFFEL